MTGGALHEITGAVHVRSQYSDGTGSIADILSAARKAGLGFVILSDHDTTAAWREGWEGRHDGVTLVCGAEVTPRRRGHCLALNVRDVKGFARLDEEDYLNRIREAGGFAVIAHPHGKRKPEFNIHHVPWQMWEHPAVRAIEVWSFMHDWIEHLHLWNFGGFGRYFTHPNEKLSGPEAGVLSRWDEVAAHRRLAGVCGLDCHARAIPLVSWLAFPYEVMFRSLKTHLFLPIAEPSPADVLEAVAGARAFVAFDALADATGARLTAECECGARLLIGDEHACGRPARVTFRVPLAASLRLVGDGRTLAEGAGEELSAAVPGPCVVRAEARLNRRPWVFTNHIYLRGERDLILASGSPRRHELLQKVGRPFRIIVPAVDESHDPDMPPADVAVMLAERKARAVAEEVGAGLIIGADTLVAIDDDIIGKPNDREHAVAILSRLSGSRHAVISGVCVIDAATGRRETAHETTWITMRRMTDQQIRDYVNSGEADGKAGAYAIQETGDRYVTKIEGGIDNVVGLPVGLVRELVAVFDSR